jgi:hypothetical protein
VEAQEDFVGGQEGLEREAESPPDAHASLGMGFPCYPYRRIEQHWEP